MNLSSRLGRAGRQPFAGAVEAVCGLVLAAAVVCGAWAAQAQADAVRIVALGASNTYGKGVGRSAAWPAQLEAMLRAKGIDAQVTNAGVNGDTTRDMLARLDYAVPSGTRLVILQPSGYNDRRKGYGSQFKANLARIGRRLAARRIKVIHMRFIGSLKRRFPQPDGIHLSARGHRQAAAMILPQVLAAIRR